MLNILSSFNGNILFSNNALHYSVIDNEGLIMERKCKHCLCVLSEINAAKNGRNGAHFRNECKPCRSKRVIEYQAKDVNLRRIKANTYARKTGKVKQYPCTICKIPTLKNGSGIFCSDRCRLWSYIRIENDCWIFTGTLNGKGYGCFSRTSAHRASYKIFKGDITEGKFVCHKCDVKSCVNPDHLWLGTHEDNMLDMVKKERHGKSKLTAKQVQTIRKLAKKTDITNSELCDKYSVSSGTISNIIARRIWKHI